MLENIVGKSLPAEAAQNYHLNGKNSQQRPHELVRDIDFSKSSLQDFAHVDLSGADNIGTNIQETTYTVEECE